MNDLKDYLEDYILPTIEMVDEFRRDGVIGELQSEMIISSLLDTADEFDTESNDTINYYLSKYIN